MTNTYAELQGALADVAHHERKAVAARARVQDVAKSVAARLQSEAPIVYTAALCLENDGDFYRKVMKLRIAATIANPQLSQLSWETAAAEGLQFYKRHYAGRGWNAPPGAVELLAAYFRYVAYAHLIEGGL